MNRIMILYASKSGTTKKVAQAMARSLAPECDLYDLRKGTLQTLSGTHKRTPYRSLNLGAYRAIVLGSAMYMGKPLKPFLRFCQDRTQDLLSQPLFLFTCGLATAEEEQSYLWPLLPLVLANHAGTLHHLGGEINENGGWFSRMVLKEYEKKYHAFPSINQQAIDELLLALQSNQK
jgi:menaquinone-dependent protoporphyrinogen IX oxidase